MKNFPKTIACLSLSLLTIGAMGQSQSLSNKATRHTTPEVHKMHFGGALLHPMNKPVANRSPKKLTATSESFQMQYWVDDADLIGGTGYSLSPTGGNFWLGDQLNTNFDLADTNAVASRPNYNLITDGIVTFDTLMDQNLNGYSAAPGTMMIDTLWAFAGYKNTSGMNDTVIFNIDSVDANGYPTSTVFSTTTLYLHADDTLIESTPAGDEYEAISGYSVDTLWTVWIEPNFTLPRNNTKFCVDVTFKGSKADTFELAYGFPYNTCSTGGFVYANQFTQIGYKYTSAAPRTINMNSETIGWQYYYGSSVTQPASDGTIFGSPNYEWNVCGSGGAGDTLFFYEQDYCIFASINFDLPSGIDNINASGLAVGQNYPNPFNRETQIAYSLTKSSNVTFTVCDLTGRQIMTNNYNIVDPGQHIITLNANTLSPGIYFYTFNVDGAKVTKRMVITE